MKQPFLCAMVLFLSLLFFCGCAKEPSGLPLTEQSGNMAAAPSDPAVSLPPDHQAAYYYLLSRRYENKKEPDKAQAALKSAMTKDPDSSFLLREYIIGLQNRKEPDKALELAEQLAQKDPDNVENLLLLARLKKGDEKDLPGLLERILILAPEDKETFLRLGKVYMDEKMTSQALSLFSRMVKTFPDYYVAYFYLGEVQLTAGQPEAARDSFLKTLELEPDLLEPRFRLINTYKDLGVQENKSKILDVFQSILDMDPDNDRAKIELALFYYMSKEFKKADEMFALLGQKAKDDPDLVMTAAQIFIPEKRYEDAATVMTQLRKVAPGNANLNFFLGMAYEGLKDPEKAVEYYLKVTPDHPEYKKTILSIAFLYKDMDRTNEAVGFLEQHHRQSPADIDITTYLASFYQETDQHDTAITLLQTALKENPENTALLFKLGAVQDEAGQRQACIDTMKALIRIDPDHASALNYLGYTYAEMGIHLDQALIYVQRALEIRPGDGYITDSLGWVYFKKQEYDKAIYYLEQAVALSEYETVIAAHLADVYAKTGDRQKALDMYKKALDNARQDQKKEISEIQEKLKQLENQGQ